MKLKSQDSRIIYREQQAARRERDTARQAARAAKYTLNGKKR